MFLKKTSKGFTLIEIIIVAAIMGIMFAFMIVNFHQRDMNRELENNAAAILDDFRNLQTKALAGETIEGVMPQYYFLRITACGSGCANYQLMAKMPDDSEDLLTDKSFSKALITIISGGQNGAVDINFYPPRGLTTLSGGADLLELKIQYFNQPAIFKFIKINTISGRLDISPNP